MMIKFGRSTFAALAKGKPNSTQATAKRNRVGNAFMSRQTVSPPGRRVNPLGLKTVGGERLG
jgi:hypothetical protein